MERHAIGRLPHLFATTKNICDHQESVLGRSPRDRQEHALPAIDRDIVVFRFESERARHPATAGLMHFIIESQYLTHAGFAVHFLFANEDSDERRA